MNYTAQKMDDVMQKQQVIEQAAKAQELRQELAKVGRWGIVTWNDGDLEGALFAAGLPVTKESVTGLRQMVEDDVEDRMTETGFEVIAEAIEDIREVMFPNVPNESVSS
jgi:hypothetical protein